MHQPRPAPLLSAALAVPWFVALASALCVGVGLGDEARGYPTPFAIANAYRLLVGTELFFVLAALPLLASGRSDGWRPRLPDVLLLLALAGPAVVVAAWAADCRWPQVAASQAYLVAAALFVEAFLRADRGSGFLCWYWLALGALGAGCPFVVFVVDDLLHCRLWWLSALSPFWAADRLGRPWGPAGASHWWAAAGSAVALMLLGALVLALSRRRSRLTASARLLY